MSSKVGMYSKALATNWPWPDPDRQPPIPSFDELIELQKKLKPIACGPVRMTEPMFQALKAAVEVREVQQIDRFMGMTVMVGRCTCAHFVANGWCMHR